MIFKLLFFAMLATAMGQSVVMTTLPSLGRQTGLTELQVATIMSSSAIAFALGNTLWSSITKKLGFRRLLMLGLTGYTIGTIIFASVWLSGFAAILTGSGLFAALLLSRCGQAVVMSASPPAAVGYAIAISPPQERIKAISKVSSANNLGQILGPSFAGVLVGFGLLVPLYTITLLTLGALVLIWKFLPNTYPIKVEPNIQPTKPKVAPVKISVALLIFMSASVFCTIAMMQQSLGFFMIDQHGETPVQAAQSMGLAMMISAICALAIQVGFMQRTQLLPSQIIPIAIPVLALGYLILYLHHAQSTLYLAMILIGCGMGTTYPAIAALATSVCKPENQARVTGMITASPAMGFIIGPPLAALFYANEHRLPFLIAALILTSMTLIAFVSLRGKKEKNNAE
jgi:MFS family permease